MAGYESDPEKMRREVDEILDRVDRLPELDSRSPDEIIGYDERGLPSSITSSAPTVAAQDEVIEDRDTD